MDEKEFLEKAGSMEGLRDLTRKFCEPILLSKKRKKLDFHIARSQQKFEVYKGLNHFHPDNEFVLQVCGTSSWATAEGAIEVKPGQVILLPRGVPHLESRKEDDGQMCNINLYIMPNAIGYHSNVQPRIEGLDSGARVRGVIKSRYSQTMVDLLDEIVKQDSVEQSKEKLGNYSYKNYDAALVLKLFELVIGLTGKAFVNTKVAYPYSHLTSSCIQEILSHVCSTELNVAWLANQVNRSPDYISNVFKKEVGKKLTDYINEHRILFAKKLLETSLLDINQIARSSGYIDPNYFGRVFKKSTGLSPREYRNLHKSNA